MWTEQVTLPPRPPRGSQAVSLQVWVALQHLQPAVPPPGPPVIGKALEPSAWPLTEHVHLER